MPSVGMNPEELKFCWNEKSPDLHPNWHNLLKEKYLTFEADVTLAEFKIRVPLRAAALRLCSADDAPNFAITPTVSPIMMNVIEAPSKTIYFEIIY